MATAHVTNLKLGISQEEFLKNTEAHLETLYEQNETQNNSISNAEGIANKALTIAQGKANTEKYADLSTMVTALNKLTSEDDKTFFNVGDIIYIVDTDVPDFWVTTVNSTAVTSNTVNTLINNNYGETQFGWFTISKKEDSKLNLTNMVEATSTILQNEIVIGDDNTKKVKGSGYSITTTLEDNDSKVPTSKAVYSAIDNKISSVGTGLSERINKIVEGNTTVGKATKAIQDGNGDNIVETYATKDELAEAGKVKDVKVNGESVLDKTTGIANIDLSDIPVGGEPLATDIKQATLINYPNDDNPEYKAIQMPKTSVVIEVLKKENNEYSSVVTQSIVVGEFTYYLLDKSATGDYWYREAGGDVVSGGGSNAPLYMHSIYAATQERVAIPGYPTGNYAVNDIELCFQTFAHTPVPYTDLMTAINKYMIGGNSALLPISGYFVAANVETGQDTKIEQLAKAYVQSGVLYLQFAVLGSDGFVRYIDRDKKIKIISDNVITL